MFIKFLTDDILFNNLTKPKFFKNLFSYIIVKMNKLTILDINKINGIKYYLSIHSQQKKYLENYLKNDIF